MSTAGEGLAERLEHIAREHVLAGHFSEPSAEPPCMCVYCREARTMREAAAEIRRLTRVLELERNALERYMPCPDCRDKVPRGECQRCARQRAEARAERAESALSGASAQGKE